MTDNDSNKKPEVPSIPIKTINKSLDIPIREQFDIRKTPPPPPPPNRGDEKKK